MKTSRLIFLYQQYIDNLSSEEELRELEVLLSDPENEAIFISLLDGTWKAQPLQHLKDLSENKADQIYNRIISQYIRRKPKLKNWLRAAAIFITLSAGLAIYQANRPKPIQPGIASAVQQTKTSDILPGSNKAILTLADGKSVVLDDAKSGEISNQQGVVISKLKNGQLIYAAAGTTKQAAKNQVNTIAIPKGGQYHLTLPDGTHIYLNSASSLSYPTAFNGNERKVFLEGEAYFEVAKVQIKDGKEKGKRLPFIVVTKKEQVEVLGTHFNINSYADEAESKTTLLEGSVRIAALAMQGKGKKTEAASLVKQTLIPGQQAVLKSNTIKVNPVDLDEVMAWKNGLFVFNNENITAVMRKIARWYDVEVLFKGNMEGINFLGNYSRSKSLDNLLKNIELMEKVDFQVEGRRITVSRK